MIDPKDRWFPKAMGSVFFSDVVLALLMIVVVLHFHLNPLWTTFVTLNYGWIGMGICLLLWFRQQRKEKDGRRTPGGEPATGAE